MYTPGNNACCIFCLEEYTDGYRKLECGHNCCYMCAKQLAGLSSNDECPKCRKTIRLVNVDLHAKFSPIKAELSEDTMKMCDRCQTQSAKVFCVFCQLLLCQEHMLKDQQDASKAKKPSHYHVQIRNFLSNTDFYIKHFCKQHTHLETSKACYKCRKTFCQACDPTEQCKNESHWISTIKDVTQSAKNRIEELRKLLPQKVERFSLYQKEIMAGIKQVNDESVLVQEDVDQILQKQNKSTQEGELAKAEIMTYASISNRQLESCSKHSKSLEEEALGYLRELTDIKNMFSSGRLLERFAVVEERIDQLLKESLKPVYVPKIYLVDNSGSTGSLQIMFANPPSGMQEYSATTSSNSYWSVRWITEELLISGRESHNDFMRNGVELRDRQLKLIRSMEVGDCSDVLPCQDGFIVLENHSSCKRIMLYSKNFAELREIANEAEMGSFSQITTADDKVYASDPMRKCVYVWTIHGELTDILELTDMADPCGLCITRDGSLLISDCSELGSVQKYQLDGYHHLVWKCSSLIKPYGMAEDCTGLIYVSKQYCPKSAVYVLSCYGQMLKEVTCDGLTTSELYGLSIFNDFLAIACGTAGIKVFKLNY